jgi:type I restriction enzyme S subunit
VSFKPYPKYKESGVEWLGRVPEHWELCRSDAVLGTCRSTISPEALAGTTVFHYSIPVVQLTGDGQLEDGSEIDSGKLVVTEPQVLVSKLNPRKGTVCIARPQEVLTVCSSEFVPLLPRRAAIRFVWYLVQSENYRTRLESLVESATKSHQRAAPSDICRVQWAFPPNEEQELISAFLDQETAKIDALIAEQQRLIELLQEKRQAVISHAVTKGLNPDAPMKDSGIEWLGEVPEHWSLKRLKHVSPYLTVGIVVNPSSYVADEGLPFIYGGDIREGVVDWANSRRISPDSSAGQAKTRLRKGDLLMVRVGAPGVTAVVPFECEGGNCASVMLIRQGEFSSDWLCSVLNTRIVRFQVEVVQYGAAQEQFNISHAVNFWTPVPPRLEQDAIAERLSSTNKETDSLIAAADEAITLLQERRSALISAAVTGQIDVRGFTAGGSEAA